MPTGYDARGRRPTLNVTSPSSNSLLLLPVFGAASPLHDASTRSGLTKRMAALFSSEMCSALLESERASGMLAHDDISGRRVRNGTKGFQEATAAIEQLIEEAIVDAYDEWEQAAGFFTKLEDHLALPFKTRVLGDVTTVESIDLDDLEITALCRRGDDVQEIRLIDLSIPADVAGGEWIAAYRLWRRGG